MKTQNINLRILHVSFLSPSSSHRTTQFILVTMLLVHLDQFSQKWQRISTQRYNLIIERMASCNERGYMQSPFGLHKQRLMEFFVFLLFPWDTEWSVMWFCQWHYLLLYPKNQPYFSLLTNFIPSDWLATFLTSALTFRSLFSPLSSLIPLKVYSL